MSPGPNFATPETRVATSDARFDMRLTANSDDTDQTNAGWTWVAAILIAGVLIVSGYLDQEAGSLTATSKAGERYAVNSSTSQTVIAAANQPERRADKGY